MGEGLNFADIVGAAYAIKHHIGISQHAWGEACETLGRAGAAICVLITDQATLRENNPVQNAGGYFRGMVAKGQKGELQLHASLFGILKREG